MVHLSARVSHPACLLAAIKREPGWPLPINMVIASHGHNSHSACGCVVLKYIYRVKGVLRWVPCCVHYITDLLWHYSMQKRGGQERASWVPPTRSVMPTRQCRLRHFYGSMIPHFYMSKFVHVYVRYGNALQHVSISAFLHFCISAKPF